MEESSALMGPSGTFVELFCSCTPYIKMHQGETVVIHISSEVLDRAPLFDKLMEGARFNPASFRLITLGFCISPFFIGSSDSP